MSQYRVYARQPSLEILFGYDIQTGSYFWVLQDRRSKTVILSNLDYPSPSTYAQMVEFILNHASTLPIYAALKLADLRECPDEPQDTQSWYASSRKAGG